MTPSMADPETRSCVVAGDSDRRMIVGEAESFIVRAGARRGQGQAVRGGFRAAAEAAVSAWIRASALAANADRCHDFKTLRDRFDAR
ncbi:MAG: hypothetical protein KGM43_02680 [Planctomycetota bacterium]|nr:hypothetical protein [Planctomycetota bacterium]